MKINFPAEPMPKINYLSGKQNLEMHVSPAKHSYGSVTDGQIDRRTDGRTDRQTDRRWTK